jgi:hypothetical protein
MGRKHAVLLAILLSWVTLAVAQDAGDRQALARQISQAFDVLPVQGGVVLTPRDATRGFRSVDLTAGAIAIDGEPVTGSELRKRLGNDADPIIRLSYLDAAELRALFEQAPGQPPSAIPPVPPTPEVPAVPPPPPARPRGQRSGDMVRIGGNVQVGAGEIIDGDVVAIGGSADVNGEVNGDVVAIGGNLTLGPEANVDGDAVVVGGVLNRNPAARVRGEINEVGFGGMGMPGPWRWPVGGIPGMFFGTMTERFFALVSTLARLAVLCFLVSLVLVFARSYAEQVGARAAEEPVKAGLVGLLIQLLFVPALCVTIIVMVVTIIGIPLLLLIPFALLAFVLLLLVGFAAVAYDVGRLISARFGWEGRNPYLIAAAGIALVLSPVLLSRLVGFGGAFISPFAWTLLLFGLLVEYVAWTVGLGAVALVRFDRRTVPAAGDIIAPGNVVAP